MILEFQVDYTILFIDQTVYIVTFQCQEIAMHVTEIVHQNDGLFRAIVLQEDEIYEERRHLRGVGLGLSSSSAINAALEQVNIIP